VEFSHSRYSRWLFFDFKKALTLYMGTVLLKIVAFTVINERLCQDFQVPNNLLAITRKPPIFVLWIKATFMSLCRVEQRCR